MIALLLAGGCALLSGCSFLGKEIADPGSIGENYRRFLANDRVARRQMMRDAHAWRNTERARWPRLRQREEEKIGGEAGPTTTELSIATFVR